MVLPDAIVHQMGKSYFLALYDWRLNGNPAGREVWSRLYNEFHPEGIDITNPNAIAAVDYRELNNPSNFTVDDFQTGTGTGTSSSGGTVSLTVSNPFEGALNDSNADFTWFTTDPMNGMTFNEGGGDFSKGTVFDYTVGDTKNMEWQVIAGHNDMRALGFVSFRACQGTRHPETVALNNYNNFAVTLRDSHGTSVTVPFGLWGGITPVYPRTGSGTGSGWDNEMNTVRVNLAEFTHNNTGLDLSNIVAVRLDFGASFGSNRGRIGLDDLQIMAQ